MTEISNQSISKVKLCSGTHQTDDGTELRTKKLADLNIDQLDAHRCGNKKKIDCERCDNCSDNVNSANPKSHSLTASDNFEKSELPISKEQKFLEAYERYQKNHVRQSSCKKESSRREKKVSKPRSSLTAYTGKRSNLTVTKYITALQYDEELNLLNYDAARVRKVTAASDTPSPLLSYNPAPLSKHHSCPAISHATDETRSSPSKHSSHFVSKIRRSRANAHRVSKDFEAFENRNSGSDNIFLLCNYNNDKSATNMMTETSNALQRQDFDNNNQINTTDNDRVVPVESSSRFVTKLRRSQADAQSDRSKVDISDDDGNRHTTEARELGNILLLCNFNSDEGIRDMMDHVRDLVKDDDLIPPQAQGRNYDPDTIPNDQAHGESEIMNTNQSQRDDVNVKKEENVQEEGDEAEEKKEEGASGLNDIDGGQLNIARVGANEADDDISDVTVFTDSESERKHLRGPNHQRLSSDHSPTIKIRDNYKPSWIEGVSPVKLKTKKPVKSTTSSKQKSTRCTLIDNNVQSRRQNSSGTRSACKVNSASPSRKQLKERANNSNIKRKQSDPLPVETSQPQNVGHTPVVFDEIDPSKSNRLEDELQLISDLKDDHSVAHHDDVWKPEDAFAFINSSIKPALKPDPIPNPCVGLSIPSTSFTKPNRRRNPTSTPTTTLSRDLHSELNVTRKASKYFDFKDSSDLILAHYIQSFPCSERQADVDAMTSTLPDLKSIFPDLILHEPNMISDTKHQQCGETKQVAVGFEEEMSAIMDHVRDQVKDDASIHPQAQGHNYDPDTIPNDQAHGESEIMNTNQSQRDDVNVKKEENVQEEGDEAEEKKEEGASGLNDINGGQLDIARVGANEADDDISDVTVSLDESIEDNHTNKTAANTVVAAESVTNHFNDDFITDFEIFQLNATIEKLDREVQILDKYKYTDGKYYAKEVANMANRRQKSVQAFRASRKKKSTEVNHALKPAKIPIHPNDDILLRINPKPSPSRQRNRELKLTDDDSTWNDLFGRDIS